MSELKTKSNATSAQIKALIDKNIFEEYFFQTDRIQFDDSEMSASKSLNEFQETALQEIDTSFETYDISLLHGVTSSGKTEIYVKKIPSMKITDIAKSISQNAVQKIVGIRPGEKPHEQMIGEEDAPHTYEYPEHFKILPAINNWSSSADRIKDGIKVPDGFTYSSDNNPEWMQREELVAWIACNESKIGTI